MNFAGISEGNATLIPNRKHSQEEEDSDYYYQLIMLFAPF